MIFKHTVISFIMKKNQLKGFVPLLFLIAFVLYSSVLMAQEIRNTISIIPLPLRVKELPGKFTINSASKIYIDPNNSELRKLANILSAQLKSYSNKNIVVNDKINTTGKNSFILTLTNTPDTLGNEGYILSVNNNQVIVKAFKPAGIFYGLQTIFQLLPAEKKPVENLSIPAVIIVDKPRYPWRGMLLDVSRYFYSVDFVKKYIDYMVLHKMNTFHWHLTDDQGWRIEIKKYPRLTEIGAWRNQTVIGHIRDKPNTFDGKRHGGFYTQEQVKEIVAYAKERYINVVAEIEMPGHSQAALAAYPELSCTGGPFKVSEIWSVHSEVFCAGNEQTFKFLEDVLSEVAPLFPSPIIHIGGDETPKVRWKQCPKCQARIKAEGLKDEHELQSYFIKRMENFLLTKNKNIMGWDEILEGGLAPKAAVMSWRGIEGGIAAAKQHHDVVMTPGAYVYLDHYQADPGKEPLAIGGYTTLEKTYSFDPTPAQLSTEEAKFIKGAQGNLWTEYISTPAHAEYMAMPRMAALSEVVWTQPASKNWEDFKRRMQQQYKRYDALGINYSTSGFNVQHFVRIDTVAKQAIVLMKSDTYRPEIFYTIDGSTPTTKSLKYEAPFIVNKNITMQAAAFQDDKQIGKTTVQTIAIPK